MSTKCPECRALQIDGKTCQDDFYIMLGWEADDPSRGVVHHLTVLGYHLQHPSLYSPEGVVYGKQLMVDFLENGKSPKQIRKQNKNKVDSHNREWKITGTASSHGSYIHPVNWTMTAADVVAGGPNHYCDNVKAWAKSILNALKLSQNL
jgi:hypothetical protein